MDEILSSTLCLDGNAVRRIREEKKLTQLYVAKVVGVTTDTISRWENNRYPSVKRDNVIRLAEALEVPLNEILQGQGEECPEPVEPLAAAPPRRSKWVAYLGLAALVLLLGGGFLWKSRVSPPLGITAERFLPRNAAPGSVVPIMVNLRLDEGTKGFILRENFPPGWELIEAAPPPSSLDSTEGTARWIVRPDEKQQRIAYLLRVAPGEVMGGGGRFRGEIVAHSNGRNAPTTVAGAAFVKISPHIWADFNADNVIDDGEMLLASDIFDEMQGVGLDWKLLESIWDSGRYRWDKELQQFFPARSAESRMMGEGEGD